MKNKQDHNFGLEIYEDPYTVPSCLLAVWEYLAHSAP